QGGQDGQIAPHPGPLPGGEGEQSPMQAILLDPEREDEAVVLFKEVYRTYVLQELQSKGFFEDELEGVAELKDSTARKCLTELREEGETKVPVPYVCKNGAFVWVGQPFLEMFAARGTM